MFEKSINLINEGNCLLFVGSGFSFGAKNIDNHDIPSSSDLTNHFLDLAGVKADRADYDLETAAEKAFGKDSEKEAFLYLSKALRCKTPSDSQKTIASFPWRRVYTTNYDDVFETCCRENGKPFNSLGIDSKYDDSNNAIRQIVHIHGSINNLDQSHFKQDFYLTDSQGLNIRFIKTHWNRHLLDDIVFSDAVFFVGFSNSDFHLRKLIDSVTHTRSKVFFVTRQMSAPARIKIEKHGSACEIGVDGFAQALKGLKQVGVRQEIRKPDCLVSKKYENVNNASPDFSRADVRDELLFGSLETRFFSSLGDRAGAIYIDRISARFSSYLIKPARCVMVHADVGNGKSVVAHYLAASLQGKFKNIYVFNGRSYDAEIVRRYLKESAPSVIIVENSSLSIPFVKLALDSSSDNIVICTDRTKRLEIKFHELRDVVGNIQKFDVNNLSSIETNSLVDFLDANILWGDFSHLVARDEKISFVSKSCGGEIRGVLFALFNGGAVKGRVEQIFNDLDSLEGDYRDLIILLCVLNFAYTRNNLSGYVYSYEDFLDLRINFDDFRDNISSRNISEFLHSDRGYFRFKSSVFAKFYINSRVDIEYVFDLVYSVLRNIERTHRHDDFNLYSDFSKALMQFNLYRELYSRNSVKDGRLAMGRSEFFDVVHRFYERCRHLKIAQNNPLFIIQMSMAELDREQFDECEYLIRAAEALCHKGYDPYQIDTHKAEVAIKRSLKEGISVGGQRESEAFLLLKGVVDRRRERYHPFGVMDLLLTVYENSYGSLASEHRKKISLIIKTMVDLCKYFPDELREKYHIISRVHNRSLGMLRKI